MSKINLIIRSNPEIVMKSTKTRSRLFCLCRKQQGRLQSARARKKLGGRKPKLEPDELKEIKSKILDMIPFSEIGRDHNVPVSTLYYIKNKVCEDGELNYDVI